MDKTAGDQLIDIPLFILCIGQMLQSICIIYAVDQQQIKDKELELLRGYLWVLLIIKLGEIKKKKNRKHELLNQWLLIKGNARYLSVTLYMSLCLFGI